MTSNEDNNVKKFSHERVLIVGLGKTGLSCVRFLYEKGIEVAITDTRVSPPGLDELQEDYPDVAAFVGGFNEDAFTRASCLVVSPGVSIHEPLIAEARTRGVEVIGDVELFARNADGPVIAITGSNGKSTVTTLVGEIAKSAGLDVRVGGNIGVPALDLLHEPKPDLYVLELSSFQLETTSSLRAQAAVILNISEDHMDRYDDLEDYTAAKARVYHGAKSLIVNKDDNRVMATVKLISQGRRIVPFTLQKPKEKEFGLFEENGIEYLGYGNEKIISLEHVKLKGSHNYSNILASFALAHEAGIGFDAMKNAVENFYGLAHRSQWVAEVNNITWINDSKATNVGAAIAAIEGIPAEGIILLAGGQGKGQDFEPLVQPVKEKVKLVLLFGQDAPRLNDVLSNVTETRLVRDLAEAINIAKQEAVAGNVVLLSPACASFDMFNGYEDRGNQFAKIVKEVLS